MRFVSESGCSLWMAEQRMRVPCIVAAEVLIALCGKVCVVRVAMI